MIVLLLKQLEAISSYFGLGTVLSQQRAGRNANENYLVTTELGMFVFKLLLNHPLEDLQQEIIYLQRLKKHAYPAAYYLSSPQGPLFYQDGNILAVVQRKQAGHIPERSVAVNQVYSLDNFNVFSATILTRSFLRKYKRFAGILLEF
jgi:Ser/Thr protein kinase RdoA (MazF antagonist)